MYLRGELGKGDVGSQLLKIETIGCLLERFGLPRDSDELTRAFATQDLVDSYVGGLADRDAMELMICSSTARNNPVANLLRRARRVAFLRADCGQLYLSDAESALHNVFMEHNRALLAIAADARLADHGYGNQPRPVEFATCLATPYGDGYLIFDGIHRAIQMVVNGEPTLQLCVVYPGQ